MYLTKDEVLAKYPLTLGEQYSGGKVTENQIKEWITSACNLIDGKIISRYTLPFSETPPFIRMLAWEFFEYFWQKATHTPPSEGTEVSWLFPRYDRALSLLKMVESGEIPLYDSSGFLISPSTVRLGTLDSNHLEVDQIFTMGDTWDQEIDEFYDAEPTAD